MQTRRLVVLGLIGFAAAACGGDDGGAAGKPVSGSGGNAGTGSVSASGGSAGIAGAAGFASGGAGSGGAAGSAGASGGAGVGGESGSAGSGGTGAAGSGGTTALNGVRQYGGLGTKNWTKLVLDKTTKGWFRTEWDKVMDQAVKDYSCAFKEHYPTLMAKVHWSHAYVDSSIKPTPAQARDPKWSNYVWNHPENGKGFVYDGITDALKDPLVDNGKGIAKLAILVGLTASSGSYIPPLWMQKDKSLTWLEGSAGLWHTRFDNPVAVGHAIDFLTALLAKYGDNTGVHSISLAEYFMGAGKDRPAGFNRDKYLVGMKDIWTAVAAAAPRDAAGNRVNILQFNPLYNADVTTGDLEKLGIGISESDTQVHFGAAVTPETAAMKKLYAGKKVHVMIGGDTRFACEGRKQGWDGTANPFGHKSGYSGVATPQELFWYHSEKGPVPTHSFFLTMAWCSGAPQTPANFLDAIKRFGRCGTEAAKWGPAPASLPK